MYNIIIAYTIAKFRSSSQEQDDGGVQVPPPEYICHWPVFSNSKNNVPCTLWTIIEIVTFCVPLPKIEAKSLFI